MKINNLVQWIYFSSIQYKRDLFESTIFVNLVFEFKNIEIFLSFCYDLVMFYSPTLYFTSNLNHYYMSGLQNLTFLRQQASHKFSQLCQKIGDFAKQVFQFLLEVAREAKKEYCACGRSLVQRRGQGSVLPMMAQRLNRIEDEIGKRNFRTNTAIEWYQPKQEIKSSPPADEPLKQDGTNHFEQMPPEVVLYLFSFLRSADLCRTAQVSHQWSSISSDSLLWKQLYERDLGQVKNYPEYENWKTLYQKDIQYLTQRKGKSVCIIQDPYSYRFSLNYNSKTCTVRHLKLMICLHMEIAPTYARMISIMFSGKVLEDSCLLNEALDSYLQNTPVLNFTISTVKQAVLS